MIRRPPRSTRTDTLFPYTTLFRSSYREMRGQNGGGIDIWRSRPILSMPGHCQRQLQEVPFDPARHAGGPNRRLRSRLGRRSRHRSEEHTSELQSLMRISYAVFHLKKKKQTIANKTRHTTTQ